MIGINMQTWWQLSFNSLNLHNMKLFKLNKAIIIQSDTT